MPYALLLSKNRDNILACAAQEPMQAHINASENFPGEFRAMTLLFQVEELLSICRGCPVIVRIRRMKENKTTYGCAAEDHSGGVSGVSLEALHRFAAVAIRQMGAAPVTCRAQSYAPWHKNVRCSRPYYAEFISSCRSRPNHTSRTRMSPIRPRNRSIPTNPMIPTYPNR